MKKSPRRITRFKKQQTLGTNEYHQQHVSVVDNDVVFQQLLRECTTKIKRMVIEEMKDILQGSTSMVNLEENVLIAGFL